MLRTKATSLLRRAAAPRAAYSVQAIPSQAAASASPSGQAVASQSPAGQALSNPTLKNIENRWEDMPLQEQADLWMALRDRMKCDWTEMSFQEKKAAYWISFGPHGPRAVDPPGTNLRIAKSVFLFMVAGVATMFAIRYFAKPPPSTMTREWQEMSNEYLKKQNSNPITGISSEGYTGKGMIQSPPKGQ